MTKASKIRLLAPPSRRAARAGRLVANLLSRSALMPISDLAADQYPVQAKAILHERNRDAFDTFTPGNPQACTDRTLIRYIRVLLFPTPQISFPAAHLHQGFLSRVHTRQILPGR